jgi:hypothetical protein
MVGAILLCDWQQTSYWSSIIVAGTHELFRSRQIPGGLQLAVPGLDI